MDVPTRADLFNIGRAEVLAGNSLILPAELDREGSDANTILQVGATFGETVIHIVLLLLARLTFARAEGEDLDKLAWDRLRLKRLAGTPALAVLRFTRADTSAAQVVPAGTVVKAATGEQFRTIETGALPIGAATVDVQAESILAGRALNVAAGAITSLVSAVAGALLTVSNAEAAAGGSDRETDPAFRDRCALYWVAARRGTREALEYGARTDPAVAYAVAEELLNGDGSPGGPVRLVLAGADQSALNAAVLARVLATMEKWRCLGVPLYGVAATTVEQVIIWEVDFEAGIPGGTTVAAERLRLATVAAVNAGVANQTLDVARLYAAARSIPGVVVYGPNRPDGKSASLVEPVSDVIPSSGQVIRTSLPNVIVRPRSA